MTPDDSELGKNLSRVSETSTHNNTPRRRWERLPIAIPVFVRGSDEAGKEFVEFTTAININAGGMMLVSRRSLPPGSLLTLEFPTPTPIFQSDDKHFRSSLAGGILYMKNEEGYHLCGLQFDRPLIDDPPGA
jgi:PilZ domain